MEFDKLKQTILERAKDAEACKKEYGRAYKSTTVEELMQVIKDNFNFAVIKKVIDPSIIEKNKAEFNDNQIYCNVDVAAGFLLAWGNATVRAWGNATVRASDNATVRASDNATVRAWGNATVEAWGNATVEAWGNATVEASDNATVEAWGNATVEASGNAYITSYHIIECKLSGNSIYRIRESNTIRFSSENIKFEKVDK